MHLTITSTVVHAPYSVVRCIRSVQDQSHQDYRHHVWCGSNETFYAAHEERLRWDRDGERLTLYRFPSETPRFENLLPVWRKLPAAEPIVWLDGDDWLAVPHALRIVSLAHERGALVTYGSFLMPDGSRGFAEQVQGPPRDAVWGASHLKTFRAGLVARIRDDDFRNPDGTYANHVADLRVMFPCLEMAPTRSMFIDRALVVYNLQSSFYMNATHAEKLWEDREGMRVRRFARYDPLTLGEMRELFGELPEARDLSAQAF